MNHIYTLLVMILFSCCKEEISPKTNVLSEKIFVNIIKDIHLNEAKFDNLKRLDFEKYKLHQSNNLKSIFLKYKISHKDFKQSMSYYISQPEKLERIYNIAIGEIKEQNLIDP